MSGRADGAVTVMAQSSRWRVAAQGAKVHVRDASRHAGRHRLTSAMSSQWQRLSRLRRHVTPAYTTCRNGNRPSHRDCCRCLIGAKLR
jgi:hypothetical protein